MYCIECGSHNLDRAKFCQQCGAEMPAPLKGLPAGEAEAAPPAARPAVPVGLPVEPAPEKEKAAEPPAGEKPEEPAAAAEEKETEEKEEATPEEEAEPEPTAEEKQAAEEAEPAEAEEKEEAAAPQEKKEPEAPAEPAAPPSSPAAAPLAEVPQAIPVMKITVPPEAKPAPAPQGETTQPTLAQARVETEATQPTLPQAAARPLARPPAWPPEPPKAMKVLGTLCIIAGSLNTLINTIAPVIAMLVLWNKRGAELALVAVPVAGLIWLGYSLLLLVGGIGMVRGRPWGRSLCLFFAWTSVLVMIYSILGLGVVEVIINLRGAALPTRVLVVAALFVPALTVVLLMGLLTGRIKRWAEFMAAGPGVIPPARPELSMPAAFSLLISLVPFPPFAHMYSIILGFVGLRQIARSKGRKCGRGKAIAGTVISGLVLLVLVGGVVAAIVAASNR